MTYYKKAQDLFKMVEEGKLLEVLDKYYHEDIKVISDDGTVRNGKEEVRNYNKDFIREIQEVMGEGVKTITSDEIRAITIVEFWFEIQFKNGYKKKLEQVAIQYWKGDLIIKENLYSKK